MRYTATQQCFYSKYSPFQTIIQHIDWDIEKISSMVTIGICMMGITFNVLNIVVATRKPFKGSLHIYLIALSVVDGLLLLTVLPSATFRCGSACYIVPPISVSILHYKRQLLCTQHVDYRDPKLNFSPK